MASKEVSRGFEIIIRPRRGWQPVDLREIWVRHELLFFLIWRDIKLRYKQTLLGGIWAIIQPLIGMVVFTIFFHRLAGISSDGPPYPLFAYAGLVSWSFFSNAITNSSNSLVGNQHLISKVFFPRVFIPLASIGALLLDMLLGLVIVAALMVYYRWPLSSSFLTLPIFILGTILAATGFGLLFSALNVSFRDVKYALPFFIQMGIFVTPVIYPLRYIPSHLRIFMSLNPMSGMVAGFRHALLGSPLEWSTVWVSLLVSALMFITGLFIFHRMELRFADII